MKQEQKYWVFNMNIDVIADIYIDYIYPTITKKCERGIISDEFGKIIKKKKIIGFQDKAFIENRDSIKEIIHLLIEQYFTREDWLNLKIQANVLLKKHFKPKTKKFNKLLTKLNRKIFSKKKILLINSINKEQEKAILDYIKGWIRKSIRRYYYKEKKKQEKIDKYIKTIINELPPIIQTEDNYKVNFLLEKVRKSALSKKNKSFTKKDYLEIRNTAESMLEKEDVMDEGDVINYIFIAIAEIILPSKRLEVFKVRFTGLSAIKTANRLDTSVSNVNSHNANARNDIKEFFKNQ